MTNHIKHYIGGESQDIVSESLRQLCPRLAFTTEGLDMALMRSAFAYERTVFYFSYATVFGSVVPENHVEMVSIDSILCI